MPRRPLAQMKSWVVPARHWTALAESVAAGFPVEVTLRSEERRNLRSAGHSVAGQAGPKSVVRTLFLDAGQVPNVIPRGQSWPIRRSVAISCQFLRSSLLKVCASGLAMRRAMLPKLRTGRAVCTESEAVDSAQGETERREHTTATSTTWALTGWKADMCRH